jgi:hypothetical protein
LPVKKQFSQESSLLVFLVDHIKPLVEASAGLFGYHSDNEVAHNSVCLGLHLRNQMLLFALILFYLDLELLNLTLMSHLSLVKFGNVV